MVVVVVSKQAKLHGTRVSLYSKDDRVFSKCWKLHFRRDSKTKSNQVYILFLGVYIVASGSVFLYFEQTTSAVQGILGFHPMENLLEKIFVCATQSRYFVTNTRKGFWLESRLE